MSKNASPPATKADITALQGDIKSLLAVMERFEASHQVLLARSEQAEKQFDRMSEQFTSLDRKIELQAIDLNSRMDRMWKSLHNDASRILDVQINADKRLKRALDDHEKRLMRLESHVGLMPV